MWKRIALVAVVGVLGVALAMAYLAMRPAHASASRAGRRTPVSVSCPTAHFCMLVDDQGDAIQSDDGTWSHPRTLQDTSLTSVSCSGPTFCVAVGVNGTAFVFRGSTWSGPTVMDPRAANQVDGFGTSGVNTVSCATPTFCMAGDVLGRVSTFNGTRWTHPRPVEAPALSKQDRLSGTAGISSVSCVAPRFCAVVTVHGRALTFDGTTWSGPDALEPATVVSFDELRGLATLGAVSCSGPSSCDAVDPAGNVFTFNGTTWSGPRSVAPQTLADTDGATSISCPTSGNCVVVDDEGNAVVGSAGSWSAPVSVEPDLGLATISCAGSSFCVALDDLGRATVFDGHSWSAPRDVDS